MQNDPLDRRKVPDDPPDRNVNIEMTPWRKRKMQNNPFNTNENAENADDPLDGSNLQEDPLRQDEMCKMTPWTVVLF